MTRPEIYATRGPIVRIAYLAMAVIAWLWTAGRRRRPVHRVTLCYHGVTSRQQARFAQQMHRLAGHLARHPGTATVTFDDAFANLRETAIPVTTALGLPVTIFAVAGNLGTRPRWALPAGHRDTDEPTMDAGQLAALATERTVTIGGHGMTHTPLTALTAAEARDELVGARRRLESITGRPVTAFAFPHGACDDQLIEAAFDAGYREVHVLDRVEGRREPRGAVVERFGMSPDVWPIEFALTVAGAYAWLPRLRRRIRASSGLSRLACRLSLKWPHNRDDTAPCPAPRPAPQRGPQMTQPAPPDGRRQRILAVASGGGHWVQLLRLRPALAGEDVTFVTVNAGARDDVGNARLHVVRDATRWSRWSLIRLAVQMAWICLRERPDVIVTTGAAPGYFAVLFGRLLGARTAWIDSMANVKELSLSGRKAGRHSDLWLTQWPALAGANGPRYEGAVL